MPETRAGSGYCLPRSAIFGLRAWTIFRLNRVVHLDGSTVAEPEDTRTHNLVSWVKAGCDGNLIASRALHLHYLLAHSQIRLSLCILHLTNDVHRVAVRRIVDGRSR